MAPIKQKKLPTVPIKKKKILTSHKIKKTLASEQLLTSHNIISSQMLNIHHTPRFFFVIGKYINPKL